MCLCTGITLWGPDVATSIIPVNSNLMVIFLGPHDETSLKSYRMMENVQMQKVLSNA